MAVVATGNDIQPYTLLRDTIAESAKWQTITESADATAAAKHVHLIQTETVATLPRMRIGTARVNRSNAGAGGTGGGIPSGTIPVRVFDLYDESKTLEDEMIRMLNWLSVVLDEVFALSQGGSGAYLFLQKRPEMVELDGNLVRFPSESDQTADQFVEAMFEATWGLDGAS
jgi:hypothetical protein